MGDNELNPAIPILVSLFRAMTGSNLTDDLALATYARMAPSQFNPELTSWSCRPKSSNVTRGFMCIPHCDSCLGDAARCGTWSANCCDGLRCCGYDATGMRQTDAGTCTALASGNRECMAY